MKIRTSVSILQFQERAETFWHLEKWDGIDDPDKDLLFFGLYNDRDWAVFDNFKGNKSVFWGGTDILQVLSDYERRRILKNHSETKHYCENEVEAEELRSVGFNPEVIPSFLDNVKNYSVSYQQSDVVNVWLCGHNDREEEYGLGVVRNIASKLPNAIFHIYGIDKNSSYFKTNKKLQDGTEIDEEFPNIKYHGKVEEEQFNKEIRKYQCGLRTNDHDGFSEVIAKSLLLGQYPISKIPYEKIATYKTEEELIKLIEAIKDMKEPNLEARSFWLKKLNNFPFCERKYWNPDEE